MLGSLSKKRKKGVTGFEPETSRSWFGGQQWQKQWATQPAAIPEAETHFSGRCIPDLQGAD